MLTQCIVSKNSCLLMPCNALHNFPSDHCGSLSLLSSTVELKDTVNSVLLSTAQLVRSRAQCQIQTQQLDLL